MPKQNRVTPFGDIVATSARGTLMGNRGVLHDGEGRIKRPYQTKRWIICQLTFKGRRRQVMKPGFYTELFFLDEATALAAGHRPCWECRRTAFYDFRRAWAMANPALAGDATPKVDVIDNALHRERIDQNGRKVTYQSPINDLPDGTFIIWHDRPHLLWAGMLRLWTHNGYGEPIPKPTNQPVIVLTPSSTVQALGQGYRPVIHIT
jgi:hypothetical protein